MSEYYKTWGMNINLGQVTERLQPDNRLKFLCTTALMSRNVRHKDNHDATCVIKRTNCTRAFRQQLLVS